MKRIILTNVFSLIGFLALSQDVMPVSTGSENNTSGAIDYVIGDLVSDTYINADGFINISFLNIIFENSSLSISANEPIDINIKLYPNPVSDTIFITGLENFNYTLYDTKGVKFLSDSYSNGITISQLQKGIYYLRVSKENNVKSFKIVKK